MNDEKSFNEVSSTKRKRQRDGDDEINGGCKNVKSIENSFEHCDIRFDFIEDCQNEIGDLPLLLEKMKNMKEKLNHTKSHLSNKDIVEWNRHTAYVNLSSKIIPYLRDKLHIELATQAWTKMYEILAKFPLINIEKLTTLHLCEAPGAFITALNHFLVTQNEYQHIDWNWFAQSLNPYYEHEQSTAEMLISDDRLIYQTIAENHWDFGVDNSGNILDQANIDHYISRFQHMGISLITADGGFDVQDNPGEQELLVYPLVKSETFVALSCLAMHGHFVLKLFTVFEQVTIQLIYLLYQTFRQISIYKPTTSKKGNSEMYAICMDFNRDKFLNDFKDHFPLTITNYPQSFLEQIFNCSHLFQSNQINAIEYNLHYFEKLTRKTMKILYKIKDRTLDRFLHTSQLRELLTDDRHLLKSDFPSSHLSRLDHRIVRTGSFDNPLQINSNDIRMKCETGYFCLNCSNNRCSDLLCDTCLLIINVLRDQSLKISSIYVGELKTNQQITYNYVYGKKTSHIRNSCFANRYLLELVYRVHQNPVVETNNELPDLKSLQKLSSIEISDEQFQQLQQFANNYQIKIQKQENIYYVQSEPILSRLQASILYILTNMFNRTSVYVIPASSYLLFIFETTEANLNMEFENSIITDPTIIQIIDIHQLLDDDFAFNLIQANNICLQLKSIGLN